MFPLFQPPALQRQHANEKWLSIKTVLRGSNDNEHNIDAAIIKFAEYYVDETPRLAEAIRRLNYAAIANLILSSETLHRENESAKAALESYIIEQIARQEPREAHRYQPT